MSKTYFTIDYFEFFIELALNNQKSWFDENRKTYEKVVRPQFLGFAADLREALTEKNPAFGNLDIKKSIFRINRDIRFSKDKAPYKTFFSAIFSPHGNKSMKPQGLYVEIGPEKCGLYSGSYMPEKEELAKIRARIFEDSDRFNKIINQDEFKKYFGEVKGSRNKRIDKQWMAKSEEQPFLLNKQFYVQHFFEAEDCLKGGLIDKCLNVYRAAESFNDFLI